MPFLHRAAHESSQALMPLTNSLAQTLRRCAAHKDVSCACGGSPRHTKHPCEPQALSKSEEGRSR